MVERTIAGIVTEVTEPDGTEWMEAQVDGGGGAKIRTANLAVALALATTVTKGAMSATDKAKLDGVAAGATANSPDVTLLNRANHTGTQLLTTISDAGTMAAQNAAAVAITGGAIDNAVIDGRDVGADGAALDAVVAEVAAGVDLDEIGNPSADKTFTMGAHVVTWRFTNPNGGMLWELTGGWSGHVLEVMDVVAAGDGAGGDHLLHLETNRLNVAAAHFKHTNAGVALLVDGRLELATDSTDLTKTVGFDTSGVATATTRTVSFPDQDVDLTPNTGTFQGVPAEGAFADGDKTKLDGIEPAADVTDATNVAAAGAYVTGGADVPVADGGTGASTASGARTNLGLGTIATQSAGSVAITGGTITGTDIRTPTVSVTGTTKTLGLTDANSIQECSNAGAQTITIPANATTAIPVGSIIGIEQHGAGAVTVTGAAGVSVNGSSGGSVSTAAQYGAGAIRKIGTDAWISVGALS